MVNQYQYQIPLAWKCLELKARWNKDKMLNYNKAWYSRIKGIV